MSTVKHRKFVFGIPLLSLLLLGGCGQADAERASLPDSAVLSWNGAAREIFAAMNQPVLSQRTYALVSVAQLGAMEGIERARAAGEEVSASLAVGTASSIVLSALHPDAALSLDDRLEQQRLALRAVGEAEAELAAGERVGQEVAERVLAYARADGADAVWSGEIPVGEEVWRSADGMEPIGRSWGLVRPWSLQRVDELRPAAPPALGSPEFIAALEEVVRIAETRTTEQNELARKWMNPVDGYWNEVAAEAAVARSLTDAEAARVFTLLNVAMLDAAASCFDAKYHYWLLRPSHSAPELSMAVDLPNHPSFPSGHSCASGAAAAVLGHAFPELAADIEETADEIALSRLYAGVHYRFDNDTGLAIGTEVGRRLIAVDPGFGTLLGSE